MAIANEKELLSMMKTAFPPVRKALVIAPHPDDEVFGCGGTVSLLQGSGSAVTIIIVTDGALGGDNADGKLIEIRAEESRVAARVLGLDTPAFWGLPDRGVDYGEVLIGRLIEIILDTDADLVFLPSPAEWHPDHQAIAFAGAEAIRRLGGKRQAAFYEVSDSLPCPNLIHDISAAEEKKRQAMRCFHSQLQGQPYDTLVSGINSFRALHLGAQAKSAEAFTLLSASDLDKGLHILFDGPSAYRRNFGFATSGGDIPLVSVIIRSMDRPTLADALDSLALQTYSNIEVVLVNAKGSDHHKMEQWCGRFPLRFIDSDQPLRRSRAANHALEAASGEYMIFLDDDDWFMPDHVSMLVETLTQNPDKKVAYGCVMCADEKRTPIDKTFCHPFDRTRLLVGNFIPIHAALFSRAIVDGGCRMDESLDLYEDWDFWLQAAAFGDFVFVNHFSAAYRFGGQSGQGCHANPIVVQETLTHLLSKWCKTWRHEDLWNIMIRVVGYEEKTQEIIKLQQHADLQQQHVGLQQHADLQQQHADLQQQHADLQQQHAGLQQQHADLQQQHADLQQQHADLQQQHADLQQLLDLIMRSRSWRLTAPLRSTGQWLKKLIELR